MHLDAISYLHSLFDNALKAAELDIKTYLYKFNLNKHKKSKSLEELDTLLQSELSSLASKIKELGYYDYFDNYQNKEILFSIFQSQCMDSDNLDIEQTILKSSVTLHSQQAHIEDCLNEIDDTDIQDLFCRINDIIYNVELFMNNKIDVIKNDNLHDLFNKLLKIVVKPDNFTEANISTLSKYWDVLNGLNYAFDKGEFDDNIDSENEIFIKVMNDCFKIADTLLDFLDNHNLIPEEEERPSILDIMLKKEKPESTVKSAKQAAKKSIPNSFSYIKYTSHLTHITDMLGALKKNKFVADNTELKDFRKIFNNTLPDSQVVWTGNISELVYFVKVLHSFPGLFEDLKSNIWKVTAKLFIDSNGNPFDWKKFRSQKTPARATVLDKAVAHLK